MPYSKTYEKLLNYSSQLVASKNEVERALPADFDELNSKKIIEQAISFQIEKLTEKLTERDAMLSKRLASHSRFDKVIKAINALAQATLITMLLKKFGEPFQLAMATAALVGTLLPLLLLPDVAGLVKSEQKESDASRSLIARLTSLQLKLITDPNSDPLASNILDALELAVKETL